ncbi:protein amnionless, partial [Biomphalaria pfeifferi]
DVLADNKKWLPDTNFNNPKNWSPPGIPCGDAVVILPTTLRVVYVQVNTTMREMILPVSGELILGQNMNIGFTDQPQANCPGGDVDFDAGHMESWLNPNNWCNASGRDFSCDLQQPVLDTERVPCNLDSVIFPLDHLFAVDMSESFNVSLKSFKYQRVTYTSTSDLIRYLNSTDGRLLFHTPEGALPITIDRNQKCQYGKGCPCGNDKPEIANLICSQTKCNPVKCYDVIRPVGSCCNLCGVVFNITVGQDFNLQNFRTEIRSRFFASANDSAIVVTTSITSDNFVQLLLTDTTGDLSKDIGRQIEADLQQDIQLGGLIFNVKELTVSFGSPVYSTQRGHILNTREITGISVAVVAVVIGTITVIILIVCKNQGLKITMPKLSDLPRLPRFPSKGPRPTAHVTPGFFFQPHTSPHIDPGFANPLYDTATPLDDNVVFKEMKVMGLSEELPTFDTSDRGFQNPMYGVEQPLSDPTSVDIKHKAKDSSI